MEELHSQMDKQRWRKSITNNYSSTNAETCCEFYGCLF